MLMSDAPGFPCPSCKAPITATIQRLFTGNIYCSGCGLELRLDQTASHDALSAAHRLDDAMSQAEAMKADALSHTHLSPQQAPERTRSRPRRR
jgi:uncharacterized Zn finger protein (UPF0148 family)